MPVPRPLRVQASPKDFHRKNQCELCDTRFGVLSGRHHCRICCRTVCGTHFSRPLCVACELDRNEALHRRIVDSAAPSPAEMEAGDPKDIPVGDEDVNLCKDVYATAFTLANNATPGLYSFNPLVNRDMILVWFYLGFITFSQARRAPKCSRSAFPTFAGRSLSATRSLCRRCLCCSPYSSSTRPSSTPRRASLTAPTRAPNLRYPHTSYYSRPLSACGITSAPYAHFARAPLRVPISLSSGRRTASAAAPRMWSMSPYLVGRNSR